MFKQLDEELDMILVLIYCYQELCEIICFRYKVL